MGKAIGIHLGDKYSVIAYKDKIVKIIATGPNNENLCRSCVAIDKNGHFVVGNAPYKNWKRYAPNIVTSIQTLMGTSISDPQVQRLKSDKDKYPFGISKYSANTEDSVAIVMNGTEYTPEQICAEFLRQLKEDASINLGDIVTHAVITVPAYFNERQKAATRKAAELAGIKVQRLLPEPTAAAIFYGADKMSADEDKIYIVYDFNGSSFNLSVFIAASGNLIESGTGGDRRLGGDNIDKLLSEYVLSEAEEVNDVDIHGIINELSEKKRHAFQGEFKSEIDNAKSELILNEYTTISLFDYLETKNGDPIDIDISITRENFNEMIRPLVQRTIDLIDELLIRTAFPIETIDSILMTGEYSRFPLVREMLISKYGHEKLLYSDDPMYVIAKGAAICASSIGTNFVCPNCGKIIPIDTNECPSCHYGHNSTIDKYSSVDTAKNNITSKHHYFIKNTNDTDNVQYTEIIGANQILPLEVNHKLYTQVNDQKIVCLNLYSEAENGAKEKIGTAYGIIKDNLPIHSEILFTIRLTEDETIGVNAIILATGQVLLSRLTRGCLDTHCFDKLFSSTMKILQDEFLAENIRNSYLNKINRYIEKIEDNNFYPDSKEWMEIEHSIQQDEIQTLKTKDDWLELFKT